MIDELIKLREDITNKENGILVKARDNPYSQSNFIRIQTMIRDVHNDVVERINLYSKEADIVKRMEEGTDREYDEQTLLEKIKIEELELTDNQKKKLEEINKLREELVILHEVANYKRQSENDAVLIEKLESLLKKIASYKDIQSRSASITLDLDALVKRAPLYVDYISNQALREQYKKKLNDLISPMNTQSEKATLMNQDEQKLLNNLEKFLNEVWKYKEKHEKSFALSKDNSDRLKIMYANLIVEALSNNKATNELKCKQLQDFRNKVSETLAKKIDEIMPIMEAIRDNNISLKIEPTTTSTSRRRATTSAAQAMKDVSRRASVLITKGKEQLQTGRLRRFTKSAKDALASLRRNTPSQSNSAETDKKTSRKETLFSSLMTNVLGKSSSTSTREQSTSAQSMTDNELMNTKIQTVINTITYITAPKDFPEDTKKNCDILIELAKQISQCISERKYDEAEKGVKILFDRVQTTGVLKNNTIVRANVDALKNYINAAINKESESPTQHPR